MKHHNTNIMWFDAPAKPTQWRRFMWWFVAVLMMILFTIAWGLEQFVIKTQSLSVRDLRSIIHTVIRSPSTQRTALTLINYIQQRRPVPSDQLLGLYDNWYQEHCIATSYHSDIASWSSSHPWCQLYPHREELIDYLWYREPKTYLILLQNSAEVRPNGWFYGSFARVELSSGMIQDMSIHDSYEVPFINSWVALSLPEWTKNYLWHNTATFIAGNKFGFTDRDGFTIAAIYDKTYNTQIDGVIFMSTKTLTALVPSLQVQLWKRQFINAAVDLIRGNDTWFKKQLYMDEIRHYLSQNNILFLWQAISNYHILFEPSRMQVYLPEAKSSLRATFKQLNRVTDLDSKHLYLRDLNQAYNKIDTFVIKKSSIYSENGQEVMQSHDNVLDLSQLPLWSYQLKIEYQLSMSPYYLRLISQLEKQYDISLTDRERHILGVKPLFEYRSVVFAGTGISLTQISGDGDQTDIFAAPPAQWAAYHIRSTGAIQTVTIKLETKN
jgi:hypothetical protein